MRTGLAVALSLAVLGTASVTLPLAAGTPDETLKKPELTLKSNPSVGFAPMRTFLSAELKGGPDDYQDYYCPTVEWDWGDGTKSESTLDCDPYEAGKSAIKRRFAVEHVFRHAGRFAVHIRLKKKDKVMASASTTLRVQASIGH